MQKVENLLRKAQIVVSGERIKRPISIVMVLWGLLVTVSTFGQDISSKKINLDIQGASFSSALAELQKQGNIKLVYDEKVDKYTAQKVNLRAQNITIKAALEHILENTDLYPIVSGQHIIISEKKKPAAPNAAAGQGQGTGGLKGRVVEFETSQPLAGASILVLGTNKSAISDSSGYYRINGIPAGKKTLEVSFVGFTTETIVVDVRTNREEVYDIKLQGGTAMEEVVISSMKTRRPVAHASEKQVLQEIKMSQSVVSGISSQQISKTADRNAAEVVQKIAGVTVRDDKFIVIRGMNERYNLTYLNGNIAPSTELHSRAFALDLIPTRIIDRIMVYKSPAPELMADMTGGAVKIFTKDAKTVKHFDIEFRTGVRQNTTFNKDFLTHQGGKYDFLGFDDGLRKLPSSVPGYGDFTKANISQKTYAETFNNILEYGKKTALPPLQLNANYYNTMRLGGKFLSILSSLSYQNEATHLDMKRAQTQVWSVRNGAESQNTDASQMSLLQNFNYVLDTKNSIYFKNFLLQQGQQYTLRSNSHEKVVGDDQYLRNIVLQWTQRFLYSGNIGGQHKIGDSTKHMFNWNTGYTYSRLSLPDQRIIRLQNAIPMNDVRFPKSGDFEQNYIPIFRGENVDAPNNNVDLGHISRLWTRNNETVYNGSADYTFKTLSWVTLKVGTYQQWKERVVFRKAFTLNEGDLNSNGYPVNVLSPGIGTFAPEMDFNTVFWRQQDLGNLWSHEYLRDNNTALKVYDRTNGSDAYIATEQNNSGYVAASLQPFDNILDIYGGVRVEHNRQKVAGAIAAHGSNPGDVNRPVLADLKSTEYLPSLNVSYRPNINWVVRAAYGKTVNRPEFRELSPYAEMDYVSNQQIQGNTDLVFARAKNYDLRFEWYPRNNEKGETISIGGFYKDIINPIERTVQAVLYPTGGTVPPLISFQNADKANVYGLEMDLRKNLDFISGSFFRNLSLIANGSWIFSKVETDTSGIPDFFKTRLANNRRLQGQAPYQFNVGLYYDNAGSGTRAAFIYNHVGERIYAAAVGKIPGLVVDPTSSARGSLIELSRKQLDFSLTQRIVSSLQAKFSIQNILNQHIDIAEDRNFSFKYDKYRPDTIAQNGTTVINGDLISQSYKPGRFFLFTLTYGF